tara:strand:+ start:1616 stop:1891 length:276 start_codon:yes stop_codon:yes gene_type:complete
MNQDRRKEIESAIYEIRTALDSADNARSILRDLQEQEQEAFDNMPEGLQQADRGQAMEQIAQDMDSAIDAIESAIGEIESELDNINSAINP